MIRPFLLGALLVGSAPFAVPAAHACLPRNLNFPCAQGGADADSTHGGRAARRDAGNSTGLICAFASVADPTADAATQSGQLSGGPVVLTEADGTTPETGTLTCRVQVDQATHTGSGPSVSGHGTAVLTAGPSVINYVASATSNVYLCSEFTDDSDGVTYYWNDELGEWSADPNTGCGLAFGSGDPTPPEILIDSIVCPVLAIVFPPEGDVVLPAPIGAVWDCPPYGNI